jgi:hypothetical protein
VVWLISGREVESLAVTEPDIDIALALGKGTRAGSVLFLVAVAVEFAGRLRRIGPGQLRESAAACHYNRCCYPYDFFHFTPPALCGFFYVARMRMRSPCTQTAVKYLSGSNSMQENDSVELLSGKFMSSNPTRK